MGEQGLEHDEPHKGNIAQRLNWLRAGGPGGQRRHRVHRGHRLGRGRGDRSRSTILTAGIAGLSAGAMSMAVGEYVSVSPSATARRSAPGEGAGRACRLP